MARADYVARVKSIVYGQGMGEKPAYVIGAADASESVSGSLVTFALASGEGDKVKAGDVLSVPADTEAESYALYVTSVATDSITAINGYLATTEVTAGGSPLDSALFEVNPQFPDAEIHRAIDTVFSGLLYPQAFKLSTETITPNLATGEAELNALDMEVLSAHQLVGGVSIPIPVGIQRNLHTSVSSTGVLGYFDFYDSGTVYLTTKRKLAIGDESTFEGLVRLVATGAAALLLGASVSETDLERAKKDSQGRRPESAAQLLWRDFLTLKVQYAEDISRDTVTQFIVYRG